MVKYFKKSNISHFHYFKIDLKVIYAFSFNRLDEGDCDLVLNKIAISEEKSEALNQIGHFI